ncbi:ABC transporter substrate-binding protein [Tissierella sp.]|uniref:ABC transporter substrate-binding protein n=1 Tax=Tissierella sp. TaxID=41274 RepID=UPI0028B2337A|nr:ABC transporter substrate-binding protein [Tissierella sp.]
MKKIITTTIIFIIVLSMLIGCNSNQTKTTPEISKKPLTLIDPAGNEILIPNEINRIISMAPSITEILVELGFGDRIIAIDKQSKDVSGLTNGIPNIDMMAPDAEKIIALKPDIVIASTITMAGGNDPLAQIKKLGISLAYIPSSNSIEGIYNDIIFISKVLNSEERGKDIINNMKDKITEIKKIGDTITSKKSVYFEIAALPNLYSFGKGVFLNEMIDIIGAVNILNDKEGWLSISEELVIDRSPDVVITNVNYIENPVDEIKSREGWRSISAVKDNQVYYVDNMSSSLPNHNIIKALEEMARAVYPDLY